MTLTCLHFGFVHIHGFITNSLLLQQCNFVLNSLSKFAEYFQRLSFLPTAKMISDVQLAVFCNVLGVFLFLLVVGFHYINANMGRTASLTKHK
ncbi:uncharacterized protein LOC134211606 [Armigeres subalbatus]|uniref:uncharacterized protein LOC134211606 n=1 Tax=Armigeres subalbatus TaxID=124917 RepID=UPI002ECFEB26